MNYTYFKPRGRFEFKSHRYTVGVPIAVFWKSHYDRHFLNRIYERLEEEYGDFYQYHLAYFLQHNNDVNEQQFFEHVWYIVKDRIEQLIKEDKNDSKHAIINQHKMQLRAFQKYLQSIDQWSTDKSKDEIIAAKEEEIKKLKDQVSELKQDLKAAKKLETEDYINIADGYVLAFADILLQIQEAMLPGTGKELAFSQTQIVWPKMIAKYCKEGNKEISLETIRRYFPADKDDPSPKYAKIPPQMRLFQIRPARKRS